MKSNNQIWWEDEGDLVNVGLKEAELEALGEITCIDIDGGVLMVESAKNVGYYELPVDGNAIIAVKEEDYKSVTATTILVQIVKELK